MNERMEWEFLGMVLGTATGWDGDEESFVLYEFEPAKGIALPKCDLNIDVMKGLFQACDDDGKETFRASILDTLRPKP